MRRRYVNELGEQETVAQVFRVSEKQLRPNRNGNLYLQMELSDRSGRVNARMWNASELIYRSFENGDYVHVEGATQLFQGTMQLIATRLTKMEPSEVNEDDFTPLASVAVDKLVVRLGEILRSMTNPHLRNLAECFLVDEEFMGKFTRAPAGVKNHHAYLGGLLEHVVNLMEVTERIVPCYPQIDRDLLITVAFIHDMAKVDELAYDRDLTYSDEGQLVGHLVMAVSMLEGKDPRGGEVVGRVHTRGVGAAAEAPYRQPSRRVRIWQPQTAHDPGGGGSLLSGQPRRQGRLVPPTDARRPKRGQLLDEFQPESRAQIVQGKQLWK